MPEADTIDRVTSRKVQVASLPPADSGRGLARLPDKLMDELGLAEGDVIEIVGKRSTAARAIRPYGEDESIDIIRLDGLQRANAGVGSGDFVEVRKAESKPATRVVFAPAQPNVRLQGSADALKRTFAGRPLVEGDTVATTGHQRINADMPDHIRQLLNAPAFALQELRLVVVVGGAQGHRPHRRQDRGRAASRIYGGRRRAARRRHLRRPRRHARHDRRAARDGRASASPSRAVPAARRRSAQGRAAPRPARHRQDPARARRRQRKRGQILPHRRARDHGLGLWRERAPAARDFRAGRAVGAVDHLHRRDRFDRAQARPGHGRGRKAARRPAADPARRDGAAAEHGRHRRDQPPRSARRGASPARPLRPRDRRRRSRPARPPRNPRHPHPRHAACARRRPRRPRAPDLRLRRRRPRRALPRGRARSGPPDHAADQPRRETIPTEILDALTVELQGLRKCAEARAALRDARGDGRGAADPLGRHRRPRRGARPAEGGRRASA